jgi:hypothetical protein
MRPYHRIFDILSEENGLITINRRLDDQAAQPDPTQEGRNWPQIFDKVVTKK